QKGQFTIHGHNKSGINKLAQNELKPIDISVITIRGSSKKTILKELFMAGITHSMLFPDLDGLSKEVCLRYSNEFMS
ncbi:MAG: hypothetical protein ACXW1Q_09050, partial [Halobacteriota archaeon]